MIIREATLDDAPAIARVTVDTWRSAYRGLLPDEHLANLSYEDREKFCVEFMSKPENKWFTMVAEAEPCRIVGFAAGGPERTERHDFKGEIYAIYVLQEFQHQGAGRLLTHAAVEKLAGQGFNSLLVWTLAGSPYRRFYEALGGRLVDQKSLDKGDFIAEIVAYGWDDFGGLLKGKE